MNEKRKGTSVFIGHDDLTIHNADTFKGTALAFRLAERTHPYENLTKRTDEGIKGRNDKHGKSATESAEFERDDGLTTDAIR